MIDLANLYGIETPADTGRPFAFGDISFVLQDGVIRHLKIGKQEMLRSISFLVRDKDWGTLVPIVTKFQTREGDEALTLSWQSAFQTHDARLVVDIAITVGATGLTVTAEGRATDLFETNRTGFTVLHPINGIAGQPARVTHSDDKVEQTFFPDLIAPWQPIMDIKALTHHVAGYDVTCKFTGEIFEMEDQRQWGDASFKTYNRPLALPWPYTLTPKDPLAQSVDVTWDASPDTASTLKPSNLQPAAEATFPQTALVITPDDAARLAQNPTDIERVKAQRLLCHFDATLGDTARQLRAFAAAQRACQAVAFNLELIGIFDPANDPLEELGLYAKQMADTGFAPDSIMVCPAVDRQSTPPGSDWPPCPPLEVIHTAARHAFPNMTLGGGAVSLFPEINRKRPPVDLLDFISHGLCPIVHAADDLSVMETLEAVPHITGSARAIAHGGNSACSYRIGPATLAMRQNPYGSRTIPNPDGSRICMTDDDPRHRAAFGAAYLLGLATALASGGVSVWTPAALYGPRGLLSDDQSWPLAAPLRLLCDLAGEPVHHATITDGLARLQVGDTTVKTNLTPQPQAGLAPYGWTSNRNQRA